MVREEERLEIKTMCVYRLSSDFCEDFSPMAEWKSGGDFLGVLVCVLAISSFVTAVLVVFFVTVSSSDVAVIGEVALSESEREIVESQTSLPPKSAKRFSGEHQWSTLDKVFMARIEHNLDRSEITNLCQKS